MEYQDKKAYSEVGPIGHVDALASMLSISAENLLAIFRSVESFRIPGKTLRKKSGEPRPTSNAKEPSRGFTRKLRIDC